jgi:hypothetical protein
MPADAPQWRMAADVLRTVAARAARQAEVRGTVAEMDRLLQQVRGAACSGPTLVNYWSKLVKYWSNTGQILV